MLYQIDDIPRTLRLTAMYMSSDDLEAKNNPCNVFDNSLSGSPNPQDVGDNSIRMTPSDLYNCYCSYQACN